MSSLVTKGLNFRVCPSFLNSPVTGKSALVTVNGFGFQNVSMVWVVLMLIGDCVFPLQTGQIFGHFGGLIDFKMYPNSSLEQESGSVSTIAAKTTEDLLDLSKFLDFQTYLTFACACTVFENHRKSLIQHCERSELRLHFEWTKVD